MNLRWISTKSIAMYIITMTDLNEAYEKQIKSFRDSNKQPSMKYFQDMITLTRKEIVKHSGICYDCNSTNLFPISNDGGSVYSCEECGSRFQICKDNNKVSVRKTGKVF